MGVHHHFHRDAHCMGGPGALWRRVRSVSVHLSQPDSVDGGRATSTSDPDVQNRQAARERLAASLDYEINLKAEVEIMALHDKLDRIRMEELEEVLRNQSQR